MTPEQAAQRLQGILASEGAKHIVLITGKRSFELSGASGALLEPLRQSTSLTHFNDVPKNPDTTAVDAAAQSCDAAVPDLIVAIGGGSAMDLAKALSVRLATRRPAHECLAPETWQELPLTPILAIPTTTGTGSEATQFAVVYHQNKKYSLSSPKLLPKHVLLVPSFTQAQPLVVRAASGFDALSQAVESYWSGHGTNKSDDAALKAITLATPHLKLGLIDFSSDVAADMQQAANLAGQAINQTRTTAPHALSYALTTDYGIDHGQAVGLMLPKIWRLHQRMHERAPLPAPLLNRMQRIGEYIGGAADTTAHTLETMLATNKLSYKFQELGLSSRQDWVALCKRVNLDRLKNHPVALRPEDIEGLWDYEIPDP